MSGADKAALVEEAAEAAAAAWRRHHRGGDQWDAVVRAVLAALGPPPERAALDRVLALCDHWADLDPIAASAIVYEIRATVEGP